MSILRDRTHSVHAQADEGHTDEDERWAAENLNDDWHDLDHEDAADVDPEGDDRDLDARAGASAYLDSHELGLKTF